MAKLREADLNPVMCLIAPKRFHAGVDEAGRGPLAGPVAAAAVILNPRNIPDGLNDSKQLTAQERDEIFAEIVKYAVAVSVAFSCNREIDSVNIHHATLNAMSRALHALNITPKHVWIDGKFVPKTISIKAKAVVGGDALHACIAAASIAAKVTRDRKMIMLDKHFPHYGFASHKGYSTPQHLAALNRFGPCVLHRRSFAPVRELQFAFG